MKRIKWSVGVVGLCFIGTLISMSRWVPAATEDSFELGTDMGIDDDAPRIKSALELGMDVGKPCQQDLLTCCSDAKNYYQMYIFDRGQCQGGNQQGCTAAQQDLANYEKACNGCTNCSFCSNGN